MYLGLATILAGFAVLVGTWPYLLAPPVFLILLDRFKVPLEEARLARAFGPEWEEYRSRVRRWV